MPYEAPPPFKIVTPFPSPASKIAYATIGKLPRSLEALNGVLVFEGERTADIALRAPAWWSIDVAVALRTPAWRSAEELRDFWLLGGPLTLTFGSFDIPSTAEELPTPDDAPVIEFRFGWVHGLAIPIDLRLSIVPVVSIHLLA